MDRLPLSMEGYATHWSTQEYILLRNVIDKRFFGQCVFGC